MLICVAMSCESLLTMSFLTPRSTAILRLASKPSTGALELEAQGSLMKISSPAFK